MDNSPFNDPAVGTSQEIQPHTLAAKPGGVVTAGGGETGKEGEKKAAEPVVEVLNGGSQVKAERQGAGGKPPVGEAKMQGGLKGKSSVPTVQDLQLEIEVLREVNAHLNGHVERSTYQIDTLSAELDAWKKRAKVLTDALNVLKKEKGGVISSDTESLLSSIFGGIQEAEGANEKEVEAICQAMGEDDTSSAGDLEGVDLRDLMLRGNMGGWLVDVEEVHLGSSIGEGAFGTTYMGTWRGAPVAVKTVTVRGKEDMVSFLREVEALAALRHPNVMPFLGACIQVPDKFWLICEYMPGGTVSKWLHGDGPRPPLLRKLQFALEIAQGMQACHQCNPPIIHRDLKPSNVFIDGSGHVRIGDFGLARRLQPDSQVMLTSETGTYVYMSPEMIRHEVYGPRTDVWSWGVVACELIAQALPYSGQFLTPIQVAMAVSQGKLKPIVPQNIHPGLNMLLDLCFLLEPDQRPTFEMVVSQMSAVLRDLKDEVGLVSALDGTKFCTLAGEDHDVDVEVIMQWLEPESTLSMQMNSDTQSEGFLQRLFSKSKDKEKEKLAAQL